MAANAKEGRRKILERHFRPISPDNGSDPHSSASSAFIPTPTFQCLCGFVIVAVNCRRSSHSTSRLPSNHYCGWMKEEAKQMAMREVMMSDEKRVSAQGGAEESDTILLKADPDTGPYHSSAHEFEHQNGISSVPTSVVEQVQQLPGSSGVTSEVNQARPPPDSSVFTTGTEQQSRLQSGDPKFFTPGEISSAITASKTTRLCCSIGVALLVVLSYLEFPLLDSKYVKSILSFRPLYLVLVTNVTVLVVQLFTVKGAARR